MGRGNVCTFGKYEGLYFIDYDDIHIYRKRGQGMDEEPETCFGRELSYEDHASNAWEYDEYASADETAECLSYIVEQFTKRFGSFTHAAPNKWLDREQRIIMESRLFYVTVQDNQWSLAVKLIQREDPYNTLSGVQRRHYRRYLDALRDIMLEYLPQIGTYSGPWTSGTLKAGEKEVTAV